MATRLLLRPAMSLVVLTYQHPLRTTDGRVYTVRACGRERAGGTWEGWLGFTPVDGVGRELRTGQETTQPNRDAVADWASGLEPIYFEGAFTRAS